MAIPWHWSRTATRLSMATPWQHYGTARLLRSTAMMVPFAMGIALAIRLVYGSGKHKLRVMLSIGLENEQGPNIL